MLLFICYCFFLLAAAIFIGTGKWGILDFIHSFRHSKMGAIIAIPLLVPCMFLIKLTRQNINIDINDKNITIENKKTIRIPIQSIDCIKIHEPRVNTVNLYSQEKLLYCFDTGDNDGGESLINLAQLIIQRGDFNKSIKKKKIIGGEIDTFEYMKNKVAQ